MARSHVARSPTLTYVECSNVVSSHVVVEVHLTGVIRQPVLVTQHSGDLNLTLVKHITITLSSH